MAFVCLTVEALGWCVLAIDFNAPVSAKSHESSLFPTGDDPDVVLSCHTYNEISVQAGEVDGTGQRPQDLSQKALKKFLKNKKHKDHIVIWLEKSIDRQTPAQNGPLVAFEDFAKSLGYKRTIFDSDRGGHQDLEKQIEPVIVR